MLMVQEYYTLHRNIYMKKKEKKREKRKNRIMGKQEGKEKAGERERRRAEILVKSGFWIR